MGSTRLTMDVPGHGRQEEANPDGIGELLSDRQTLRWLDIRDPGPPGVPE